MIPTDARERVALRRFLLVAIPAAFTAVAYLVAGWGGVVCLWLGPPMVLVLAVSQAIEMAGPWP